MASRLRLRRDPPIRYKIIVKGNTQYIKNVIIPATNDVSVSDIMSTGLVTVTPDRALHDCLRLMEQNGIYHLLVVDAAGAYRGMVSVTDMVTVIASDEKARADMLEAFLFERTSRS